MVLLVVPELAEFADKVFPARREVLPQRIEIKEFEEAGAVFRKEHVARYEIDALAEAALLGRGHILALHVVHDTVAVLRDVQFVQLVVDVAQGVIVLLADAAALFLFTLFGDVTDEEYPLVGRSRARTGER